MSLRLASILILTTALMLVFNLAHPPPSTGSAAPTGCHEALLPRPVTIQVAANRAVTVSFADLVPDLPPCMADAVVPPSVTCIRDQGAHRLANRGHDGAASISGSFLTFVPSPGFVGVSTGWELAISPDDAPSTDIEDPCRSQASIAARLATVQVNFEVRNTLPVAIDDSLAVPAAASRIDVDPEFGLLANDLDRNGDLLVIHSAGTTTFPWGLVEIDHQGAYRVVITDHDLVAPAVVPYVVWDQQGSTSGVDRGYLQIDFEESQSPSTGR